MNLLVNFIEVQFTQRMKFEFAFTGYKSYFSKSIKPCNYPNMLYRDGQVILFLQHFLLF